MCNNRRGLCRVLKIFLPFSRKIKKKKNLHVIFFFFLIDQKQTDRQKTLFSQQRERERERRERHRLHSFTHDGRRKEEEAFSFESSKKIIIITFRERTFFTLERKKRVLKTTRDNKVLSLSLFSSLSCSNEIKESLDETRRRLLGAAFRSLAAKRSKRERERETN